MQQHIAEGLPVATATPERMRFLVEVSNRFDAITSGLPLRGSVVEFSTLADFLDWQSRMGRVIVHEVGWEPSWPDYAHLFDADEVVDEHLATLPGDWRSMRWIEVYNGYRE